MRTACERHSSLLSIRWFPRKVCRCRCWFGFLFVWSWLFHVLYIRYMYVHKTRLDFESWLILETLLSGLGPFIVCSSLHGPPWKQPLQYIVLYSTIRAGLHAATKGLPGVNREGEKEPIPCLQLLILANPAFRKKIWPLGWSAAWHKKIRQKRQLKK